MSNQVSELDYTLRSRLALRLASAITDNLRLSRALDDDRAQLLFCKLTDWFTEHTTDSELIDLALEKAPAEVGSYFEPLQETSDVGD